MRSFILIVLWLAFAATAYAQEAAPDAGAADPISVHLATIESLQDDLEGLARDRRDTKGEERALILEHAAEKRDTLGTEIAALVATLSKSEDHDPAVVAKAKKLLQRERTRINKDLDEVEDQVSKANNSAGDVETPEARSEIQEEVARANVRLVGLLSQSLENAEMRRQLGANVDKDLGKLDTRMEVRARRLAAFIESARSERSAIKERPATTDEEKAAQRRDVELVDRRIDAAAESLRTLTAVMQKRELDTTEYRQLLIEATGRVTADVLDKDVSVGLLESWLERGEQWVVQHAPQAFFGLLMFCLIVLASWGASRIVRRVARRSIENTQMSLLARDFVVRTAGRAVVVVGILTGLSQLGIEMGPVLAGLGIAGFVVGFALQDTLSNFASGLMILVYQPFDVDDLIEVAGVTGVVDRMTLVSTSVLTLDNQQLVVPNNKIWNNVIRNITAQERRRVDFMFGIGYGDDIDQAADVLRDICSSTEHVDLEDEITVEVHELGDSSVNFVVRVWTETENYWGVYWAINAEVKRRFDAEGISIPFPQTDVHVHSDAA